MHGNEGISMDGRVSRQILLPAGRSHGLQSPGAVVVKSRRGSEL